MAKKKELNCCLGCGRDTAGTYCVRCVGGRQQADTSELRGRKSLPVTAPPLEDDYGEESDADSVCEDMHNDAIAPETARALARKGRRP